MSNREKVIKLIDELPEYKIGYVLAYLQGLSVSEDIDDEYCLSLVDEFEKSEDKDDFVSFDEALAFCGVSPDEL